MNEIHAAGSKGHFLYKSTYCSAYSFSAVQMAKKRRMGSVRNLSFR